MRANTDFFVCFSLVIKLEYK